MKILYFYAECLDELRNNKEQSLNFSRTDFFSYDKKNQRILKKELVHPIPEYFFDKDNQIYNTTFLVGDNGAGKTTIIHRLIDLLLDMKNSQRDEETIKAILLLESEEYPKQYIVRSLNGSTMLVEKAESMNISSQSVSHDLMEKLRKEMEGIVIIYNSNVFHKKDLRLETNRSNSFYNFSIAASLQKKKADMWEDETKTEMDFVLDIDSLKVSENLRSNGCPLPIPRNITIYFKQSICWFKEKAKIIKQEKSTDDLSNKLYALFEESAFAEVNEYCKQETVMEFPLEEIRQSEKKSKWLRNLYFLVQGLDNYELVDFDWGMSSGEENMLRMVANEYAVKLSENLRNPKGKKTILYFWDEIDSGFHPEWQRLFLKTWIIATNIIFDRDLYNEIQLFATTHSPLILSDVPGSNIAYLSNNDKQYSERIYMSTFGENLYSILANGFFLYNGTLGALAQEKIKQILKLLNIFQECLQSKVTDKTMDQLVEIENKYRIYNENPMISRIESQKPEDFIKNNQWICLDRIEKEANLFSGIFRIKLLKEIQKVRLQCVQLDEASRRKAAIGDEIKRLQQEYDRL